MIKVTIEDAVQMPMHIFNTLMGDQVEPRKNLVKEYPTNTKPVATENKQPQNPNIPKESLHATNNKTDFSS